MPLDINKKKLVADTPDDDFESAALDAKWTVVTGSSGTINPIGSGVGTYQLFQDEGVLAMQAKDTGAVRIRQTYTLPDGASILCALCPAILCDGSPAGITNNEINAGILLNQSTTDIAATPRIQIAIDAQTNSVRIVSDDNTTFRNPAEPFPLGATVYMRIARSTLTYYTFYSLCGLVWVPFGSWTHGSALTQLWLFASGAAASGTPVPVQVFRWIRQGTNGLFPWDIVT